ncbi:transcription factor UDT1-like [Senna tora]|uniref:Transcription factor UDT1-like n=1 Tax=Senna tora TaxID=362788 RepID=A0A834T100_9FABA|nr:transcription factor UDT1-like [Senna tora]
MPASRKRSLERTGSLQIERDRRSKMSHMFAELQSTVPGLFSKVTREVIVNETINYIKHLENKKRRLEELKACSTTTTAAMIEPTARTTTTSNNKRNNSSITVTLSASNVAFFGIQSKAQPGLLTRIFKVFFNHNAEILAANVSVNNGDLTLAITALLPHNNHNGGDGNGTAEKIKTEILSL